MADMSPSVYRTFEQINQLQNGGFPIAKIEDSGNYPITNLNNNLLTDCP